MRVAQSWVDVRIGDVNCVLARTRAVRAAIIDAIDRIEATLARIAPLGLKTTLLGSDETHLYGAHTAITRRFL